MIRLDDNFSIRVGDYSYDLMRVNIVQSGKKAGQESYRVVGYFRSLQGALKAYGKEIVRDGLKNVSTDLSGALSTIRECEQMVMKMIERALPDKE